MYQNDALKCLTGEVRFSYLSVHTPRQINGQGKPKYTTKILIPKTDGVTMADIQSAMQAAIDKGIGDPRVWGGKKPNNIVTTLYDGDGVKPESGDPWGPECKGHWVLRAAANEEHRPQVVSLDNVKVELDPRDVYSGMYGRATVRFYPYKFAGKCGIGCGLGNILKTRDGEPLSGGTNAETDFAGLAAAAPTATPTNGGINPVTGLPM